MLYGCYQDDAAAPRAFDMDVGILAGYTLFDDNADDRAGETAEAARQGHDGRKHITCPADCAGQQLPDTDHNAEQSANHGACWRWH